MNNNVQMTVNILPQEVLWRLSSVIDDMQPQGGFGIALSNTPKYKGTKEFIGKIQGNRFQLRRRPRYQNSSAPTLSGTVEQSANGSEITATFPTGLGGLPVKKIAFWAFLIVALGFLISTTLFFAGNYIFSSSGMMMLGVIGFMFSIAIAVAAIIITVFLGILTAGRSAMASEKQSIVVFLESIFRDVKISN